MAQALLSLEELRALEARVARGLAPGTLMARAGRAAADWIAARIAPGSQLVFVCGPGNNGGDGFVAARRLAANGYRVSCVLIGADQPTAADARAAFDAWIAAGHSVLRDPYDAPTAAAVIDALFGVGLSRPLRGEFLDAVQWMNERQAPRFSLDLPSGLDAETGTWVGGIAGVRADATLTFIAAKAGLYTAGGVDAAGTVEVAGLDVPVPLSTLNRVETSDFRHVLVRRARNSHKGSYGSCAIVGGGRGMVGAVLIAARAALRLGAGRVFVEAIGAPEFQVDPVQPELMFRPLTELAELQAIVIGCGLGQDETALARLKLALACPIPLVLDADALNLLATNEALQTDLLSRHAATILTPHPLEAARLLRRSRDQVQADRVGAARELALATGGIVVLKGAGTVIALRSGRAWINPTGSPALATAGTGDALAGMIGSLFAQGYDMVSATLAAVWLHGRAGEGIAAGLVASDVAIRAAAALDQLRSA
ncbi:MAG: NAD(P)H-hydrate dehydratase [Burkholderiaceae bacterium]